MLRGRSSNRRGVWMVFLMMAAAPGLAGAGAIGLVSRVDIAADSFGVSAEPALSADGRYVAFLSSAPNLAPGQEDDNGARDVFLRDRLLDTTTLVSHVAGSPTRTAGISDYRSLDISADGRYVAFIGSGLDLVPGATGSNLAANVFLWDRLLGTTTLVSHAAGSPLTAASGPSYQVRISAEGNFLAFSSFATDLVAGQVDNTNPSVAATADVFLWNRATGTATLVSRKGGTAATAGNLSSFSPVLSADGGVVVFATNADDLLPGGHDIDNTTDVYAWQRSTDTLSLVSRAANAPEFADGALTEGLAVSADGRYVAFASLSANLVPGHADGNPGIPDAFLYDRATGEMRLVSHRNDFPLVGGGVYDPASLAMSADGRYVAFASPATDLVPQVDTNQATDVFIYDRATGRVGLVSHSRDSLTTAASQGSSLPSSSLGVGKPVFSADGRFLVFQSFATDLVSGQADALGTNDVFLYDTAAGSVTLVSRAHSSGSTAGNRSSSSPVLSADGSVVAFLSEATDLGEGQADPYGFEDLFLYQRTSGEIASASQSDFFLARPATSVYPSTLGGLSADGRLVVFQGVGGVFLRDALENTAGATTRLKPPLSPPYTVEISRDPVLSADGRFAAFLSDQTAPGFAIGLYLHDRAAGTYTLVNHAPGSAASGGQIDGFPVSFALSPDGRWLAYQCSECGLVPGHASNSSFDEIFLYDRLSGANTLVSHAAGSATAETADGESFAPAISADGRYVVFWSNASNLVPGQIDLLGTRDLFVFDREAGPAGALSLITHRPGFPAQSATTLASSSSQVLAPAVLSEDGRFIAFQSTLSNLMEGQVDANGQGDVFLYNQGTRASVLVSHAAASPVTAGNTVSLAEFSMSADGRFLVYGSLATNLAAGVTDTNAAEDVILYDRLLGTNTLVSYDGSVPLVAANGESRSPRISADGRRVAFLSGASNLIPSQTAPAGWSSLYAQDVLGGPRTFIAPVFRDPRPFVPFPPGGSQDEPRVFVSHLSADGRRIAFNSEAALFPGDYNGTWDVYWWNQEGFSPVLPCRLLDTRRRAERPILTSNVPRTVQAHGLCGIPSRARAAVVEVTVFNPSDKGNLRFYPGDLAAPSSGILRFERATAHTESFTLPLGTDGKLVILPFVRNQGTVHVAVEVKGFVE